MNRLLLNCWDRCSLPWQSWMISVVTALKMLSFPALDLSLQYRKYLPTSPLVGRTFVGNGAGDPKTAWLTDCLVRTTDVVGGFEVFDCLSSIVQSILFYCSDNTSI